MILITMDRRVVGWSYRPIRLGALHRFNLRQLNQHGHSLRQALGRCGHEGGVAVDADVDVAGGVLSQPTDLGGKDSRRSAKLWKCEER